MMEGGDEEIDDEKKIDLLTKKLDANTEVSTHADRNIKQTLDFAGEIRNMVLDIRDDLAETKHALALHIQSSKFLEEQNKEVRIIIKGVRGDNGLRSDVTNLKRDKEYAGATWVFRLSLISSIGSMLAGIGAIGAIFAMIAMRGH